MFEHEVIVRVDILLLGNNFFLNRSQFLNERKNWCTDSFGKETWTYTPPTWKTCIFKFQYPEDAVAFKLRFQT